MKKLNFVGLLLSMMALITSFGLYSCTTDEEDGYDASALVKTWYLNESSYVTFNSDGSGSYTTSVEEDPFYLRSSSKSKLIQGVNYRHIASFVDKQVAASSTKTYHFTYQYNSSYKYLTINIEGNSFKFKVITLKENVLELKDVEGNYFNFSSTKPGDPEPPIVTEETLVGKWGAAGYTIFEFTEDNWLIYYDNNEMYKCEYRYEDGIIYTYEGEEWAAAWYVVRLDANILGLDYVSNGGSIYMFRTLDEPNTIGDKSLLYDRNWTSIESIDGGFIHMTFEKNGKIIYKDAEGDMTLNYTYDNGSHKITIGYGGEVEVGRVLKLTENVLIIGIFGEQGEVIVDYMELRVLDI